MRSGNKAFVKLTKSEIKSTQLYLGTVCWVIQISFSIWVWHTSWITSNNIEVSTSCHTSLGMPLNLKRQSCYTVYIKCIHLETHNWYNVKTCTTCSSCALHPTRVLYEKQSHTTSRSTSVGPAYIIGDGKIAITVDSGSKIWSSINAWCWRILQGNGTSSSFVQPPTIQSTTKLQTVANIVSHPTSALLCHVTSRVTSRHATSQHVTSRHDMSRHASRHATLHHNMWHHDMSHVTSRRVTSRHVMLHDDTSTSCFTSCHGTCMYE